MKHIVLLSVLLFLGDIAFAQKGHLGQWAGQSTTGELVKFKFLDDGRVVFERSRGGKSDGKTTGARISLDYTFNYSKDPHWLDLTGTSHDSIYTTMYLVQFVGPDSLRIATPKEFNKRPHTFSDAGEIYSLKRIKTD